MSPGWLHSPLTLSLGLSPPPSTADATQFLSVALQEDDLSDTGLLGRSFLNLNLLLNSFSVCYIRTPPFPFL